MIDRAAATFERVAAEYHYGRPSWPAAAVESVGLRRDAVVVDFGVSHSPGERRYQAFAWRDAFAGQPFEPLRNAVFVNEHDVTAEEMLARIGSWSQFTTMPPAERERHLAEIRCQLTEETYHVRLETQVWTTRRS